MTILRICIWLTIASIIVTWALLMSWVLEDMKSLIADPPSDEIDADL
jgi:hypothetical protein